MAFEPMDCESMNLGYQFSSNYFGSGGGDGPGRKGENPSSGDPKPSEPPLMFKDCGGLEKQITFLRTTIMENLSGTNPQYKRFSLEPPKGILFYGPPGTGKTRLAMALSNEMSAKRGKPVHFIYRKGPDAQNKYFGQSSAILREIFAEAVDKKPSVIFFDEFDGLCPSRDKPFVGEANVTIVTTLLGLMDTLPRGDVFVIGATNRFEAIDAALRRPGRFDKYLEFLPPNEKGREDILTIHTDRWKVKPARDLLKKHAQGTPGFSGADLAKLCIDAFDRAMTKCIELQAAMPLNKMNFSGLQVSEKDWMEARRRLRPTTDAFTGSNLYIPKSPVGDESQVAPLVQQHVNELAEKFQPLLNQPLTSEASSDTKGTLRAFYISYDSSDDLEETFVVSPLFQLESPPMSDLTKYMLDARTLYQSTPYDIVSRVNAIFDQAIGLNHPCILYVPHADEISDIIRSQRLTLALNLRANLEKLRGTQVILLGSGNSHPFQFSPDNPFKSYFESSEKNYHVEPPSTEDIQKFFATVLAPEDFTKQYGFNKAELEGLKNILEKVLVITANQKLGSVISLRDCIQNAKLVYSQMENASNSDLLDRLWGTLGAYEMFIMKRTQDDDNEDGDQMDSDDSDDYDD